MASPLFISHSPTIGCCSSSHFGSDHKHSARWSSMQSSHSSFKCEEGLPFSLGQRKVSMAAEGREALISADTGVQGREALISVDSVGRISAPVSSGLKVILPPRMCTLREFGEGTITANSDARIPFFESLAANIEFSSKVQHWETLSGRLAMMVFTSALLLEAITGNSVFEKMDPQRILEVCGAILASIVVAAGFAIALQAKTRVAYTVTKSYENMMNALIDNVFDSLLFNKENS